MEKLEAEFEFAITESPGEIRFFDLRAELPDLKRIMRGKAFGDKSELHWRKGADGFHLVYVSDEGACLPGDCACRDLEMLPEEQPEQLLLWGEFKRERQVFVEGRIPGPLAYPERFPRVDGGRLAVRLRHYRFTSRDEERRIARCVEVVAAEKPQTDARDE